MVANVLAIAGSDPSGGAGIQADLKAISANGAYAMAAITALTAQNTQGVRGVHVPPPDFVSAQIAAILEDIDVHAIKIGMIANTAIASAVADALEGETDAPLVLDPVMIAKGGAALLEPDAVSTLRDRLLPLARVLTPNLPEAADLLGASQARTRTQMQDQAVALVQLGACSVFLKGGHLGGHDSPDCLATMQGCTWFESPRHVTKNTHGTGCTLSAAIAAQLARGHDIEKACRKAKQYVALAIEQADTLAVGRGHGPTHHFAPLWSKSS